MPLAAPGRDVLAVVIAGAESPFAERTLVSLLTQSEAPGRVIVGVRGASTGSLDSFLARIHAPQTVTTCALGEPSTFFAAVDAALAADSDGGDRLPWLWLLHDDSAPEAHALQSLLDFASESEEVGAVGAKQVRWEAPRELLEVGIRATRSARRIPEVEPEELDQGQYDDRFEVLGVGSAGMLVRREALEKAGGLGGDFGPFGDGLELSRRLRAAGYMVAVSPYAKVRHARQSLGADERVSFAARRLAQMLNALIVAPGILLPFEFLAFLLLGPVRALGRLATKEPRLAAGELAASARLAGGLGVVARGRSRLSKARVKGHGLRRFYEYPHRVRSAQLEARVASREAVVMAEVPDPIAIRAEQARRRQLRTFAALSVGLALVAGLLAELPRLASRGLEGGALRGDSWSAGEVLEAAAGSWLASGDGMAAPVDALWALLAPLAIPAGLGFGVSWLVLLGVPLAAAVAYASSGRMVTSPAVRGAGALVWAFAPPFLDALSVGQVAGIVAHLLLPALLASLEAGLRGSVAGLGGASVLFAFASAASPAFLVPAVAVAAIAMGRQIGGRWRWAWLPLPGLAVLMPTFLGAAGLAEPWRLLCATPGAPVAAEPSALALLSFSPLGQVSLSEVLAGQGGALVRVIPALVLVALAVLALVRPRNFRTIRLGWLLIAGGWAWAMAATFVDVAALAEEGAYRLVSGWTGIGLSVAFAGLWIVLLNAADGLRSAMGNPATKTGAVALAIAGAVAPIVLGGSWVADSLWGSASRLEPVQAHAPAVALAGQASPNRTRVLALVSSEGALDARVWRGNGLELHETSMVRALGDLEAAGGAGPLASARESLAAGLATLPESGQGLPQTLREHAIGVVLVPASVPEEASRALRAELNSVKGLEYVTENETGAFWRVAEQGQGEAARLTVVDGGAEIPCASGVVEARAQVPAGSPTRTLRLAERADAGWRALYRPESGEPVLLEATGEGWNQQWDLPAGPGTVSVVHERAGARAMALLAGAALGVGLVLAVPIRRKGGAR